MKVSSSAWKSYVDRLSKIDHTAAEKVASWYRNHPDADINELVNITYYYCDHYGNAAAELACEMYEEMADASGKVIKTAEPAMTSTRGEIYSAIQGALLRTQNPDAIGAIAGRKVKTVGLDTLINNSLRDGAEFAWIPSGDTCAFCIMLASNGWQRASKKALKNGHASHVHNNCDCTYAIRFDENTEVEGYDPEYYKSVYDSADGHNWREKNNAIRRLQYRENPEKYRERNKTDYREHKTKYKMIKLAKQGNTFVTKMDDLYEYAKDIKPYKDFVDIVGHGDPFSMIFYGLDGKESLVSAVEFADILEKGGIFKGGKIRLIACQTGAGDGIVPTYLAKRFNTVVLAPDEIVNVFPGGRIILADDEINAKMGIETGHWILYGPEGRIG